MYVLSASERLLNFTAKHNAVKNTKKFVLVVQCRYHWHW
jgi:hypothetical protein